jgi:hypothetical protein
MTDTLRQLLANQYEAALRTLDVCIKRCPDSSWHAPVANLKFCQAVFHTLFFADVYLGHDEDAVRRQPFHGEHASFFADYEELEDRPQRNVYEKPFIVKYLAHCRDKAREVIRSETAESLGAPAGFGRKFARAELHVYNIRHIQHHAAQLGLRLRLDHKIDLPWVGSGWREL